MSHYESNSYGVEDSSYLAAGKSEGLRKLSTHFYELMDSIPEAKKIRDMHKRDLSYMTERLTIFLSAWLGGPKDWFTVMKLPPLPLLHQQFVINEEEKELWLLCMDKAIDLQNWDDSFKDYLKVQFRKPAEMIRRTSRS